MGFLVWLGLADDFRTLKWEKVFDYPEGVLKQRKRGGIGVLKFEVSDGCFKKSLDSRPVYGIAKEIYLLGRNIF